MAVKPMRIALVGLLALLSMQKGIGQTTPFEAARLGDTLWLSQWLKAHPTSVDTPNAEGYAPLMLAAYRGHSDAVHLLLRAGAEINRMSDQGTVCAGIAFVGDKALLRQLLEAGADPNLSAADGISPIMYAAMNGDVEILEMLLQHGADPLAKDAEGQTAWFYARRAGKDAFAERLEQIMDEQP